MKINKIYLPAIVGKGYKTFWSYKGRYRSCKGGRGSKKSKTTALNFIYRIMQYENSNLLVIRKTYRTLKDSCYTELKWAIARLGVTHKWECKESPLEMTYKPTGQKIYFRGLDDPLKVASTTVAEGSLCWMWIEEAYEITKEDDFNMLDESIRGQVQDGLFKQITLTFNPWSDKHWLKKRFFEAKPDPDILAMTTTYKCNEWLDDADKKVFETMRLNNPRRYKVAGEGEWGIVDGLIYERFVERGFDYTSDVFKREHPNLKSAFGLDFGFTNDPTALFCGLVDTAKREIYVFDELYQKSLTNRQIADKIIAMGYGKAKIRADSAEPKSIVELQDFGLTKVCRARKGKDSINNGIQKIQDYQIIVHPRCVNFITEINSYTWDEDKFGTKINKPIDDFNHLLDAMRYAMEDVDKVNTFSFD